MLTQFLLPALVAVLANSSQPSDSGQVLAQENRVKSPGTFELAFDAPNLPPGKQVRLSMDARVDWPNLAGHNPFMIVNVNGKDLLGDDLINKPLELTTLCGQDTLWVYGNRWRLVYAPDFSDVYQKTKGPYTIVGADPFHFVWNITDMLKPGRNTVVITHPHLLAEGTTLVVRDVKWEIGEPVKSKNVEEIAPAPTGPLPTYVAAGPKPVAMKVRLGPAGGIHLEVAGRTLQLASRTSLPGGKWAETNDAHAATVEPGKAGEARWVGTDYAVSRKVTVRNDHVHVADTFTNTSSRLVGVIYENRLGLDRKPAEVLLGGHKTWDETQAGGEPWHPTAMARWADLTIGLAAEDDIFRVHIKAFREPKAIGLADPQLGLAPGQSHTLEWSIYPVPGGDYWDFINAVRRNWGSNFTLPAAMQFDSTSAELGGKDAEFYRQWLSRRRLKMVCSGQTYFTEDGAHPKGILAEGTAIPMARKWCENVADWVRKMHAVDPEVKMLVYLHIQICTEPRAEELYADSKLLDGAGKHVLTPYHYPIYIYLSTLENSYGKALLAAVQETVKLTGIDGFYCDEFDWATTREAYHTTWDNCTVIINPQTHEVAGKKSNVTLLQQPWKLKLIKCLRDNGKVIVGNGPAETRTMLDQHVPRFSEMASYSFLINTHLGSPWALANHDPDESDRGLARQARRFLDHAGVLTPYSWPKDPEAPPFHVWMYPITPQELRAGMVLGKERILTNRSGRYGWPDGSAASEVRVIDGDGRPVANPPVKEIRESGRRLYEVRMPGDHFAILVKGK